MDIKRLIKGIPFENGRIFGIADGRRMLIAECKPDVKIYRQNIAVSILGKAAKGDKGYRIAIVLCGEPSFIGGTDEGFVSRVKRFEITAEVLTEGGFVEEITFEDLNIEQDDPRGEWVFSVEDNTSAELIDRLLKLKNINTIVGCP